MNTLGDLRHWFTCILPTNYLSIKSLKRQEWDKWTHTRDIKVYSTNSAYIISPECPSWTEMIQERKCLLCGYIQIYKQKSR